jgi:ABC-type uncharacterized transport system auxiliary subunit
VTGLRRRPGQAARAIGRRAALTGFGLAVLGACAPAPPPADRFYELRPDDTGRRFGTPLLDGTVVVERFAADGVLDARALVYKPAAGPTMRRYNYHHWSEAPGLMLRDAVIRAFRQANVAPRVVSPNMRLRPDYRVTGTLTQLHHERVDGTGARARLAVEIGVTRVRTGELVMLGTYERQRRVDSAKVADAVAAFRVAVTDIMADAIDDLAHAVRS